MPLNRENCSVPRAEGSGSAPAFYNNHIPIWILQRLEALPTAKTILKWKLSHAVSHGCMLGGSSWQN